MTTTNNIRHANDNDDIMRYIFLIIGGLLLAAGATAQQRTVGTRPNPNLVAVARSYGDSVVLRWGASSYTAWQAASKGGFMIERYQLGSTMAASRTVLTPQALKPLTLEEWKARFSPDDTLVGAAVQALYGSSVVTTDDPFGAIVQLNMQQTTLHGFAMLLADVDPRIAGGLALRYVDRTVDRGGSYLYRIYSLANSTVQPIDTAVVTVTAGVADTTASVTTLHAIENEREVVLAWDRTEHIVPFSAYFIERSTDGGRTFAAVNTVPYITAENADGADGNQNTDTINYRISVPQNYVPVRYRVLGVDAFGERSPSSSVIVAMGRDRTPPHAPVLLLPRADAAGVRIQWGLDTNEADLAGFIVARSEDVDGPFEPLGDTLRPDAREYVDRTADGRERYYGVYAFDTAGNTRLSATALGHIPDSIAPATPIALEGRIDSNGIVTLRWHANEETDLRGYRVLYANQPDHEFQELTTILTTDTLFTDTMMLQTLTEKIYYKVRAVDQSYNSSAFTPVLELAKPDVVAPTAPLVVNVEPAERSITITWASSRSRDIVEQTLYRRVDGAEAWDHIAAIRASAPNTFVDTTAAPGVLYEYSLTATDDAGLVSIRSNSVEAQRVDAGVRGGVGGLRADADPAHGGIVVRWVPPAGEHAYYLYRAIGDGQPMLVRSFEGTASEFVDADVSAGVTYRYAVKVVDRDGGESEPVGTSPVRF